MPFEPIRPEQVVPDDANFAAASFTETKIRKGTFGAIILNADILENPLATAEEKAAALDMIQQLLPAMVKFGAAKHIVWKNPQIQQIMEAHATKLS
jgi:hypothetical protein